MIIIGIDPGTVTTGYGVIEVDVAGGTRVLDYGCVRPPARLTLSDRYLIIFNAVEALFEKYAPQDLSIETQYVSRNVQSAIKLGMARGVRRRRGKASVVFRCLSMRHPRPRGLSWAKEAPARNRCRAWSKRFYALLKSLRRTPLTPWPWRCATPMRCDGIQSVLKCNNKRK